MGAVRAQTERLRPKERIEVPAPAPAIAPAPAVESVPAQQGAPAPAITQWQAAAPEPTDASGPSSGMQYYEAGGIEQFPLHLGKKVTIGTRGIAVFRAAESVFYALDNKTGHKKGGPLAEGLVSGEYVYCPLRECRIHLPTGQVQHPDTGQVGTYPVRLKDGAVLIGIPE